MGAGFRAYLPYEKCNLGRLVFEPRRDFMMLTLNPPIFAHLPPVKYLGGVAEFFNTILSTVRQWDCGEKHPRGTSLKLLNLVDHKGLETLVSSVYHQVAKSRWADAT